MENRHLRYFIEVCRDLNMTKAAQRLSISQPPLSRQIRDLEYELKVKLFHRSGNRLALTEAGRIFRIKAEQVLLSFEDIRESMRAFQKTETACLIIGTTQSALYDFLPGIISEYRSRNKKVEIDLQEVMNADQLAALKYKYIDIGVGRQKIADSTVKQILARQEDLLLVVPKGSSLVKRRLISLKEIAGSHLILYPRDPHPNYGDHILELLLEQNIRPLSTQVVQGLPSTLGLVASGLGVSIVPRSATKMRSDDVVFIPIKEPALRIPIYISFRAEENSFPVTRFIQLIQAYSEDTVQLINP